jgi:hypothetical protein
MAAETTNRLMLESLAMCAGQLGYDREIMECIISLEKNVNMLDAYSAIVEGLQKEVFDGINELCDKISNKRVER